MSIRSLVVASALAAVLVAGCGNDTPVAVPSTPISSTSTSTAATPTSPRASTPVPKPSAPVTPASDVTVEVTIKGGKISTGGGAVVKVKSGQSVRLVATSDVADSLHVHGYDKTLDLKPGKTASLQFTADAKGAFEVETHESGKLAFRLQVS